MIKTNFGHLQEDNMNRYRTSKVQWRRRPVQTTCCQGAHDNNHFYALEDCQYQVPVIKRLIKILKYCEIKNN